VLGVKHSPATLAAVALMVLNQTLVFLPLGLVAGAKAISLAFWNKVTQ
jgi:hypothetical protein